MTTTINDSSQESAKPDSIDCVVYRCSKREEMYLYVAEQQSLDELPEALRKLCGQLHEVMSLTLDANRKLAREDVVQVMANLADQGFHLQLPPDINATTVGTANPLAGQLG